VPVHPPATRAATVVDLDPGSSHAQHVACIYCSAAIPAHDFVHWPDVERLVSARCASCQRTVTLPSSTWRRLSRPARFLARS
jgi:hypothetical protein